MERSVVFLQKMTKNVYPSTQLHSRIWTFELYKFLISSINTECLFSSNFPLLDFPEVETRTNGKSFPNSPKLKRDAINLLWNHDLTRNFPWWKSHFLFSNGIGWWMEPDIRGADVCISDRGRAWGPTPPASASIHSFPIIPGKQANANLKNRETRIQFTSCG